jgi:PQQ-like domain
MELTVCRRDLWLVLLTGTAACTSAGSSLSATTPTAEQATLPPVLTTPTTSTAPPDTESPFFCGEFGSEVLPLVVALDRQTGEPVWRSCGAGLPSTLPTATGLGGFGQNLHLSSTLLVRHGSIGVGTVDAVEPTTGERLWSHPATEWLPVAVVRDVVIEARGIGFTEEPPGAHPADAGRASVRAVDANYNTMWQDDDVRVVVSSVSSPPGITAGDALVAVPGSGSTVFFDLDTGDEVLRENGQWRAEGDLLIGNRMGNNEMWFEVVTSDGTTLSLGSEYASVGYGTSSSDLFVSRSSNEGDANYPQIVDRATLATKWTVRDGLLADSSDGTAALVDNSIVRLVDGTDGTVLWTFDASAYGARVVDVEIGEDVVLVVPTQGF